jgi:predicted SnoaL-like aldol condensation-catalyzing enzyme
MISLALTFSVAILFFFVIWAAIATKRIRATSATAAREREDSSSSINQRNKSIVVAFTQAFNNRNITVLDKLTSVNEIEHNLLAYRGLHGVKQYFSDLMAAFPDLHITIDHIIADGNNVVVLTNTTGTPAQPLISAAGVPISRKNISFETADIYRIADNKIAEHWDIIENVKMLQSLGLIKSTSQKILPTNNKWNNPIDKWKEQWSSL